MLNSKSTQTRNMLLIGFALILIFTGSLTVWPVSQVQAKATLPPRNPPVNSGPNSDNHNRDDNDSDDDDSGPVGTYIELQASAARGDNWSQVEWQDSNGDWQPVEGWAGTLNSQGQRRWWVAAKDFGTGPFRWVVSQSPEGPVIFTSQPFSLPVEAHQIIVIDK